MIVVMFYFIFYFRSRESMKQRLFNNARQFYGAKDMKTNIFRAP